MKHSLEVLDEMEEIRQKATEHPENYPMDYVIRLLTAIVAQSYGYEDRSTWTGELKSNPNSNYSKRLAEGRFHN